MQKATPEKHALAVTKPDLRGGGVEGGVWDIGTTCGRSLKNVQMCAAEALESLSDPEGQLWQACGRGHLCRVLEQGLPTFSQRKRSGSGMLSEAEFRNNKLINLLKRMSKQHSAETVLWLPLAASS